MLVDTALPCLTQSNVVKQPSCYFHIVQPNNVHLERIQSGLDEGARTSSRRRESGSGLCTRDRLAPVRPWTGSGAS
jgi:hypothetical protein